jgi:hypothetical protein
MGMTTETRGASAGILVFEVSSGDGVKQGSPNFEIDLFQQSLMDGLVQSAGWYFGVRTRRFVKNKSAGFSFQQLAIDA